MILHSFKNMDYEEVIEAWQDKHVKELDDKVLLILKDNVFLCEIAYALAWEYYNRTIKDITPFFDYYHLNDNHAVCYLNHMSKGKFQEEVIEAWHESMID